MSSAGQIVGGVVGGVIGWFAGGNVVMGAQIGMMIGSAIDPPDGPIINGPRLDDLSQQTSTYGAFIPRNYGTIAQTGNVFWLKGDALTETPVSEESGGKGGSSTTTNTWDYSATFALGLCDCSNGEPISGIGRIWINGQLFYDRTSSDLSTILASSEVAGMFTVYLGTDTQEPDPLMQADKGIENVPAYRGLAYIVFDNLPLAKFNNSLSGAQIKVEIIKNGTVGDSLVNKIAVNDGGWHSAQCSAGNQYDLQGASNFIASGLVDPWEVYWVRAIGESVDVSLLMPAGPAYPINNTLDTFQYAFGGENWRRVYWGRNGDYFHHDCGANYESYCFAEGSRNCYLIKQSIIDSSEILVSVQLDDVNEGGEVPVYQTASATVTQPVDSIVAVWNGDAVVFSRTSSTTLASFDVYSVDQLELTSSFTVNIPGSVYAINTTNAVGCVRGNTLTIVVNVTLDSATIIMIDLSTQTLIRQTDVTASLAEFTGGQASLQVVNDLVIWGQRKYTSTLGTLFHNNFWQLDRLSGLPETLGEVVESECLNSTMLSASDLDVTELTDDVRGYRVSSLGALRGGLDPLRAAWPFDVVQHGYQIKFKRRGSASVSTITVDELDAREAGADPGVQITNSREMDTLLPSSMRLNYIDSVREYDTNEQTSDRGL